MISIATKVKLITMVLSLTMLFNIFVTYYLVQDEKTDAKIINTAGKQRMLLQKMITEFHRITLGEQAANEVLLLTQKRFEENLQRLDKGDLALDKSREIDRLLKEVTKSWQRFESLMFLDLHQVSSLRLKEIYQAGNQTLELMDQTVMAYEAQATQQRDFINHIQILLGAFALMVIIYMGAVSLGIHKQLNKFLKHSSDISGRESEYRGSELELACAHIQYFLDDVEAAIDSASKAVKQSEKASIQLASAKQNPEAVEQLDRSEDIVIEANEELYKTSIVLKKLKSKLQDSADFSF